ncbi:MAG: hypothetical protein HXY20_04580 [Acidobacteria bacterium]|nr:hypothetical protein [Acidobacteriota bacterium]
MAESTDFETLDIMDALDLAVLIEEEAKEGHEEFADQMDMGEAGRGRRSARRVHGRLFPYSSSVN